MRFLFLVAMFLWAGASFGGALGLALLTVLFI